MPIINPKGPESFPEAVERDGLDVSAAFVVADERIAEAVRRSGGRLTNAEAAQDLAEADRFVAGVAAKLQELNRQAGEVVDEK